MRFEVTVMVATLVTLLAPSALAAPFTEGPTKCQECHEAEYGVWEGTKHSESFKEIHKSEDADKIVAAVGGKSMKRDAICTTCHYTMEQESADDEGKAKAGVSCESCHGASSDWRDVHNDYGGAGVKADNETAEHKQQRLDAAKKAGMIWSFMHYDIASNCMSCHGLAHPGVDGKTLSTMLDAGHPLNPDFELVAYSQGTVKHRFYPPDVTKNSDMSAAELARFFVVGQAAKLVSAAGAASKSDHADYKAAQQKRADDAAKALAAVTSVPEAAALVKEPTEANARKLVEAIKDKDLSSEVGGLLPAPSSYK